VIIARPWPTIGTALCLDSDVQRPFGDRNLPPKLTQISMPYTRPHAHHCRTEPHSIAHCILQNMTAFHGAAAPATTSQCRALNETFVQRQAGRPPRTWSLASQDWVIAALFASNVIPLAARTYVDVGANGPILDSNTYLFDACLGWSGLCVDANPNYAAHHGRARSSHFISACVTAHEEEVVFDTTFIGQLGHIVGGDANASMKKRPTEQRMQCRPLASLLTNASLGEQHISFLSLDVEGAELGARLA